MMPRTSSQLAPATCAQRSATARRGAGVVTVFGLGTATLATAQPIMDFEWRLIDEISTGQTLIADFNRDGQPDLATTSSDGIHIYVADQRITVLAGSVIRFMAAGDLDSDGHVDIVAGEAITHFQAERLNIVYNAVDPDEREIYTLPLERAFMQQLAVGDISGDGQLDIIMLESVGPSRLFLLEHHARGEYEERTLYSHSDPNFSFGGPVAVGDLDGDGDTDIVSHFGYTHSGHIHGSETVILYNEGDNEPMRAEVIDLQGWLDGLYPTDIGIGDIDGDGDLDIVHPVDDPAGFYNYRNTKAESPCGVALLLNDAGNGFEAGPIHLVGKSSTSNLALTDADSDGRLDVALAISPFNDVLPTKLYILANRGELTFETAFEFDFESDRAYVQGVADLNRDGQPDIIASSGDPYYLQEFRNLTVIDNPRLTIPRPLVRGRSASFIVEGAEPGERVHFLYSTAGEGHSVGREPLGGLVLNLREPVRYAGSAQADASGRAILVQTVPHAAPARSSVTVQCVIHRGPNGEDSIKSTYQTRVVH